MAPTLQLRIQAVAVAALQLGVEAYITGLLEDTNLCIIYTKRIMIAPKDMWLTKRLRRDKVVGGKHQVICSTPWGQAKKITIYMSTC